MRAIVFILGWCFASVALGQTARLDVRVGECTMRLMQSELDLLKPKGEGQLIWVGPCVNGFIHGFGILMFERTDEDGMTWRNASGYHASDGLLGRPRYPAYISRADGSFYRSDGQSQDPVAIQRSQLPAWASFVAGKGALSRSEQQAARAYVSTPVERNEGKGTKESDPVARVPKDVLVEAGGGCKSRYDYAPIPGETFRWIGPCKDGLSDGLGYWIIESPDGKKIWRQTNLGGALHEAGTGYAYDGQRAWRARPGANWESIGTGQLPAYARMFLMEGKIPRPLRQPEDVPTRARLSSEAKLKEAIEKSRIKERGTSSGEEWIAVGPTSHIDVATLSVTAGKPDVYSVYERYEGRYSRVYVTCDPFGWGQYPTGIHPLDPSVPYQVDVVREVCRRSLLAAGSAITPAYVQPPYRVLMTQGRHAEAFAVAKKGAESGNTAWTRELAWHYWNGVGVAQDDAEGTRLYRRAAEAGDATAMNQVGYAMQNGKGTARDYAGAIPWLKRSAELGNSVALINLAWAYQYGNGVAQDLPLALEYANRAKARNHKDADNFISSIQAMMNRQSEDAEDSRRRLAEIEREEREERRQRQREEREEREARDRQWMDTAQALMQGAAAMKRQQDEQNARREAERRRIEADNARYREMRAEEDRRWLEHNQRQQQAALERQRQDQERQKLQEARREEERRRQPRKEKVNLPKYSGCIRVEWDRDRPEESSRWYTLYNTCAQPLDVHWCDRPGCQRATMSSTIRGGGSNRGWVLKRSGLSVSVMAACQTDNSAQTVYYNAAENQCWAWVTMN